MPLSRRGLLERTRRQPGCVLAVSSEARDYSERIAFRALDAFQYGDLAGLRADVIEQKQVEHPAQLPRTKPDGIQVQLTIEVSVGQSCQLRVGGGIDIGAVALQSL